MTDLRLKYQNHPKIIRHRKKLNPMTICIAAISQAKTGDSKIVFASDRLATDQNGLMFELGTPKVLELIENCLIMSAGNSTRADEIINRTAQEIYSLNEEQIKSLSISQIVSIVEEKFREVKDEVIQKRNF